MATYTAITDTEIDPEKPVTTSLMTKLRDNPLAMFEGASGAPKIEPAAITDGSLTAAKLATGTTERTWVLGRIASASVGAVGTYALLRDASGNTTGEHTPGETVSASILRYSNVAGDAATSPTPSGTWRCMGYADVSGSQTNETTLFLRVS